MAFNHVLKKSVMSFLVAQTIASVGHSAPMCTDLFLNDHKTEQRYEKIYAFGVDKTKDNAHFQISYESEYLFSESAALLRDYAPDAKLISKSDWLNLTDEARIQWIKNQFADKPAHATDSGLRKIVDVDFLPDQLIVDATGNLEIVIDPPVNSYKEWEHVVDYIVNKYGAGSQQAMLSKPREAAFVANQKHLVDQHYGWLNYTHLYDVFEKLDNGYSRYQKDPNKAAAQFFDHPFLGPMNKAKRDKLENYIYKNANLEMYDQEAKQFVRKSDASFKYTGGPAYRPDIAGPVRWAWEIRNAHKDTQGLKDKVLRDIEAHRKGLADYEVFSKVSAFDTQVEFSKLNVSLQNMLKDLFPSKADPRFDYTNDELLALETFRNFSLPMKDTRDLVSALIGQGNVDSAVKKAGRARLNYLAGLNSVKIELDAHIIDKNQAKNKVMGLLCTWSKEAGLFDLFKIKAKNLGHDKRLVVDKEIKKAG